MIAIEMLTPHFYSTYKHTTGLSCTVWAQSTSLAEGRTDVQTDTVIVRNRRYGFSVSSNNNNQGYGWHLSLTRDLNSLHGARFCHKPRDLGRVNRVAKIAALWAVVTGSFYCKNELAADGSGPDNIYYHGYSIRLLSVSSSKVYRLLI